MVQAITEVTTDDGQLTTDRQQTIRMKTHKILFLALIASAALAVSAQAGKQHGNDNDSQPVSRPARGNSSTSYSGSSARYSGRPAIAPSQRFSSPSMGSTRSAAFR